MCTACDIVVTETFERTNHIACTSLPSTMHVDDNLTDDTPTRNYKYVRNILKYVEIYSGTLIAVSTSNTNALSLCARTIQ